MEIIFQISIIILFQIQIPLKPLRYAQFYSFYEYDFTIIFHLTSLSVPWSLTYSKSYSKSLTFTASSAG